MIISLPQHFLLSVSFINLAQPSTMHFHFLHIQHIRQIKSNHCTKEFKLFCAMVWLYLSEWLDDKLFSYSSYLDYSSDQSGYGNRNLGTVFPLNEWWNRLTYVTVKDTYSFFDRCRVTSPDVARLNYQATNLNRNWLDVISECQFSVMRNVHLICRKLNQLG